MLPYNYTINHNTGSLILHDVQESSVDGVSFRCIVSNEAGSDVSANVTVTVKKNNGMSALIFLIIILEHLCLPHSNRCRPSLHLSIR